MFVNSDTAPNNPFQEYLLPPESQSLSVQSAPICHSESPQADEESRGLKTLRFIQSDNEDVREFGFLMAL